MLNFMLWMVIRHSSPRMLLWLKAMGMEESGEVVFLYMGGLSIILMVFVKKIFGFIQLRVLSRGVLSN